MMPGLSEKFHDDEADYDLKLPVFSLKEGLPVKELIDKHQTEFEIKPDDDDDDKEETIAESCFDFGDIEKVVNLDLIDVEQGVDNTPFDRYRRKMFNITDDGKVKKYVLKQGVGPTVPENSVVFVRYQAYFEYSEVPFDSTLWQCGGEGDFPVKYNLTKNSLIPGLRYALLTMRKGEKAEVLIHHELAYGAQGCPPRIPQEATVLFICEVDRFVECSVDVEQNEEDLDFYERNKYCNVVKVARGHYMLGNDLFKSEKVREAANKYRLVINMLHNSLPKDEEEDKARKHFIIKCYTNSCICYKKMKNYKRICIMAADAMQVDEREVLNNSKLLYFWGYAKMILGDFDAAKKHLRRAQGLKPRDREISLALKELETRKYNALEQERIMMRRAFGNNKSSEVTITEVDEVEEQFRKTVQVELERFANNPDRDSMFIKDQKFTSQEEKIHLNVAKELGLYARVVDGERRFIHIKKPADFQDTVAKT